TSLSLPREPLSLIQRPVLRRRDELLRDAAIPAVVRFVAPGSGDASRVMKVVVPDRVEPIAARLVWPHEASVLGLVFGDQHRAATGGRGAGGLPDLRDDVRRRRIEDLLGGVEPQPIEMKLFDPISGVGEKILTDGTAVGAIEVRRVPPLARS